MKIKEIGRWGGGMSLAPPPLDPPMINDKTALMSFFNNINDQI